jgi:hypothetical protein
MDSDLKSQAMTALWAICSGANNTREQNQDFNTIQEALKNCPPSELTQEGLDSFQLLQSHQILEFDDVWAQHIANIFHALEQLDASTKRTLNT